MTSIVPTFAYKQETIAFVENGLWAGKRQFGACTALGFANEQEGLVAGFIYHNYDPAAGVIEVSGYSTRRDWCNKRRLKTLFDYPFNHVGVRLVAARHSEHNTRVRRIWRSPILTVGSSKPGVSISPLEELPTAARASRSMAR